MARDTCGATRSVPGAAGLVCDKAPGHAGDHRGYLEQQDEVLFWPAAAASPLAIALYVLIRDGDITRDRAIEIVREHVHKGAGKSSIFSDRDLAGWIAELLEGGSCG